MSDEMIVRHCSPTLANLKTGNIFTCDIESEEKLRENLRCLNRTMVKKGLRVLPLRYKEGRALIYIYRPVKLSGDLKNRAAESILRSHGYCPESPEKCIVHLMKRLGENGEFPHEIGLFLGYPPEDVKGFIDNNAKCCKCVGCWKVYGDEEAAKKTFAKYKKCTDLYCAKLSEGKSIERLTVAG